MTAVGLRRFVDPTPPSRPDDQASESGTEPSPAAGFSDGAAPLTRCELCAQPLAVEHTHLVDLSTRALKCSCRACHFLFTPQGAAAGRYVPVPERYLYDPGFRMTAAQWDALSIPVGVVFVFHSSDSDQPVAFYPSPAGATESLLPLDTWGDVMAANPGLGQAQPDVEAVLLRRVGAVFRAYLVPIDACYDLVGRVRLNWRGFSGGEEVWQEIDAFFDQLDQRAGS